MNAAAGAMYNAIGIASNIVVKLPLTVVILAILLLLIRGLSQHTTAIEPISVPRALADGGYTPEVAAQRLRDALAKFAEEAQIELAKSEIVTRGELPTISVPTVGLSLDTITSTIRTFFGITRHRSISGELIVDDKLLWLRLRQNGRLLYSSPAGLPTAKADELLAEAAPAIWDESERELVAGWYINNEPAIAVEKANRIIEKPRPNESAPYAYLIKGMALRKLGDREGASSGTQASELEDVRTNKYDQAIAAYREAIKLDPEYAVARYNLGNVLQLRKRDQEALAAYREAIALDPSVPQFHNNLGVVLGKLGDHEGAIAAYREAIRQDPKNAKSYTNIGDVLHNQLGKTDEAIAEYREAVRVDPTHVTARFRLGHFLSQQPGKSGEAIAHYREIIRFDPKSAEAHYNLGVVLQAQPGNGEAAIAAYREALKLDPNHSNAHNNLGVILQERGKTEEAVAEYREALRADPTNAAAQGNLDNIPKAPNASESTGQNKPSASQ